MQYLLDNLVAVILSSAIFLMLVSVTRRDQAAAVEASTFYALKQQELVFIDVLKHDLQNVSTLQSVQAVDSTFTFDTRLDSTSSVLTRVSYRLRRTGERDGTPFYRIERLQDGASSGGSMETLTEWIIEARNGQNQPVGAVADAEAVFVSFKAAAFMEGATVDTMRWEATFRSPLLQNSLTF